MSQLPREMRANPVTVNRTVMMKHLRHCAEGNSGRGLTVDWHQLSVRYDFVRMRMQCNPNPHLMTSLNAY